MSNQTEITFNGIQYPSYRVLAETHGLNYNTFMSRLKRGCTLKEALQPIQTNTIKYRGKLYNSLKALTEELNLRYSTIRDRLSRGMSINEAIDFNLEEVEIIYKGRQYPTMKALAEAWGINPKALSAYKVKHNCTPTQALNHFLSAEKVTFQGEEFSTMTELCIRYNKDLGTVRYRLDLGWTLAEALKRPINKRNHKVKVEYRGKIFESKREVYDYYNIQESSVRAFVQAQDCSFHEAMDFLLNFFNQYKGDRPNKVGRIPTVIYNGKWYYSLRDFCISLGVDSQKLLLYMTRQNLTNHFDALYRMTRETDTRWFDGKTNKPTSLLDLHRKYNLTEQGLLTSCKGYKQEEPRYSYKPFTLKGYCATPLADYKRQLEEYKKKLNK